MSKTPTRPEKPLHRKPPAYRLHSGGKLACVTLPDGLGNRRTIMLGEYDTKASKSEYDRIVAQWLANDRRLTTAGPKAVDGFSVNELLVLFLEKGKREGRPEWWFDEMTFAIRPLKELYGDIEAARFGPLALETVQSRMVASGLCRKMVNRRVQVIRKVFAFAVAKELLPAANLVGLQAVEALRRGLTKAPESEPVRPVALADVDAVQPFVNRHVWGLIQVQLLTGCRPSEACRMRAADIDRSGPVWICTFAKHKTAHHGHGSRVIAIGPKCQQVLREFLTEDPEAFLFSPDRAMAERSVVLRMNRKSKVQPSQENRRAESRKRPPGDRYITRSLAKCIYRGCRMAGIDLWSPNQLRHTHATETRKQFGLEAAGAALGHAKLSVTELYAEKNQALAAKVAAAIG